MKNKNTFIQSHFRALAVLCVTFFLVACGGGSSGDGLRIIGDISVECDSEDGGPAACNTSQENKQVTLAWSSSACSTIDWESIAALEVKDLLCISGGCTASDSDTWRSQGTGDVIEKISGKNRTAISWLNFVDNGISDGDSPQSGDVVCCKTVAVQGADTFADLVSEECNEVP